MNNGKYILIFVSMVLVTISANLILDSWHYREGDHRRLQKVIDKNFERLDRAYAKLQANDWQLDTPLPSSRGIIMVAFENDSLIYWSDNTITFSTFRNNDFTNEHFDFISNAWYVIKPYITDSIKAYGLILVKTQYPYENDYLQNGFLPDLRLPATTELLTEPHPGSFSLLVGKSEQKIKFNNNKQD